ncbi:FAD-dependent oxidoreductase [Streptomyces sp. NPDC050636]|uniref:phytoene desaturase family protein n=1 Tax=Streptomyces sp. NPDC050636 TaxID=3154510 RepID=UPI003439CA29
MPNEVIVVGAGLAGLTSAIALQQRGYSVLVLERRSVAGGLCGSTRINGYQFTLACNDFGSSLRQYLSEIGVNLPFHEHSSIFYCGDEEYVLPPTPRTLANLARHEPDRDRMTGALRDPGSENRFEYAGQLLDATVRNRDFADFLAIPSYVSGLSPATHRLDWFLQGSSRNPDYGYDKLITPAGGPQEITDALTARLVHLGGRLQFDTDVHDVRQAEGGKVVMTSRGEYRARWIVSSQGRLSHNATRSGLELATLHIATRPDVQFPAGVHTVAHLPSGLGRWLGMLDAGQLPSRFGFHIFPCAATAEYRSFNVYFYYPRGVEEFDAPTVEVIQEYILGELERMIPGFSADIIFRQLVSPAEFKKQHDLRRVSIQDILPRGVQKPAIYDAETDIYHVGNTVGPPAYHACAAVLSGLEAAELLASSNPRDHKPAA